MKKTRNYFITGIISSLPLVITVYILIKLFQIILQIVKSVIPVELIVNYIVQNHFENVFLSQMFVTFITYAVTFWVIYVTIVTMGVLVHHYIDEHRVDYLEKLLHRIPLAKPIYSTIKQISKMVFSQNVKAYKKAVIVEYPRKGIYSIGFITHSENNYFEQIINEDYLVNIFIPTSPNPTSGMFVMIPKGDIQELEMRIDDAVKLVISGGAILPEKNQEDVDDK